MVSTRVLSPRYAVIWAAFFNFVAFLVFSTHVANTIAKDVVQQDALTVGVIFAGLVGAIAWNLLRAEVLRFSRRQARFVQLEEAWLLEVETEAEPGYTADTEFLEECFAALPENARLLLNLHYQEGNDSNEIAARLTRSRSWVRTTLFRLRQQLRTCIESKRAPGPRVGMQSHG